MQGIVSFDYFQPTEFVAVDFTETPPWSDAFDELGYGSINFVEGMGSIIIFCFFQVVYAIITAMFSIFRCGCCCKRAKETFTMKQVSDSSLNLIHGTFFEMLVCVSCSMFIFKYEQFFTTADWVSIYLQFTFAACLAFYILFITYFTIVKTGLWQTKIVGDML